MIKNYLAAWLQRQYFEDISSILNRNHMVSVDTMFDDEKTCEEIKEHMLIARNQIEICRRIMEEVFDEYHNSNKKS